MVLPMIARSRASQARGFGRARPGRAAVRTGARRAAGAVLAGAVAAGAVAVASVVAEPVQLDEEREQVLQGGRGSPRR